MLNAVQRHNARVCLPRRLWAFGVAARAVQCHMMHVNRRSVTTLLSVIEVCLQVLGLSFIGVLFQSCNW